MTAPGVLIGVLAAPERAWVLDDGGVRLPDGDTLRWAVVAEDRVHHPATEPTRRQRCVDGTPVVETAVRAPGGDVVVTAYAVTDAGGSLVLDVSNRSGTSVAFACSRADVTAARPLLEPPAGGELPSSWRTLPLAHGSSLRVALPFTAERLDPDTLVTVPSVEQVVRGWTLQAGVGFRADLPDPVLLERLVRARGQAALAPLPDPVADPVTFLLLAGQRAGRKALGGLLPDEVADAASGLARAHRKAKETPWSVAAALLAAARTLDALAEDVAAGDALALAAGLPSPAPADDAPPDDDRWFDPWLARRLAVSDASTISVLPYFPREWLGANLSAYEVPTIAGPMGFAVRWHGERPALLWDGPHGAVVRCPGLDPAWSASVPSGEALLAAPPA